MVYGPEGSAASAFGSTARWVVLGATMLFGCEQNTPSADEEKTPGLPAGTLVVTLTPAIEGVELEHPARLKAGSDEVGWTPAEDAKLSNLDPRVAHAVSVDGPYLADSVQVRFDNPKVGQRVQIPVLPEFVDRAEPSELARTPAKHLEMHLSEDGSARAKWAQGKTIISTFDLPAAGPIADVLQKQWAQNAAHKEPSDPQRESLRLLVPEKVSIDRAASFHARLQLPTREVQSASGLREVPAFDVVFTRMPPPPPESVPIEETLQALTAVGFKDATSGGFDKLVMEVLRSCEEALCTPDTVTGGWERLAVSYAVAKRGEEAQAAFFIARMSRLRAEPGAGSKSGTDASVELIEPEPWLDETDLPEAARASYAAAVKRTLPKVRSGAVSVSGRVPPPDIVRAVLGRAGPIASCYAVGLTKNEKLQGRIATRFVIDNEGRVSTVADGGSDVPDAEVTRCVLREFRRLPRLVPEAGIVTVTFPWSFSSGA